MSIINAVRPTIIAEIARALGAVYVEGTAITATANTLTDAKNLLMPNADDIKGFPIYIWKGIDIGDDVIIGNFDATNHKLTAAVNFVATPTNTSQYIVLLPEWRVADFKDAINAAIRFASKSQLVPKVDETTTLATNTYEYTVPTGFAIISRLIRESGSIANVFSVVIPNHIWYINQAATRQICFYEHLSNPGAYNADRLRIEGFQFPSEMTNDTGSSQLDLAYLKAYACMTLLQSKLHKYPERANEFASWAREAYGLGERLTTPIPPDSVQVEYH